MLAIIEEGMAVVIKEGAGAAAEARACFEERDRQEWGEANRRGEPRQAAANDEDVLRH